MTGVIYGTDRNRNRVKISIILDRLAINREVRKLGYSFENTIYKLTVNEESYIVTPRQLQIDPRNYLSLLPLPSSS